MLSAMAYAGMPSHYPHWSYGKSYEKLKTRYDYGVSGLPYEMVINSNPALAYLMADNTLCLQILTIAHVYGHNDFFKNNFTFKSTRPELTLGHFKVQADRIRGSIEDPSIGIEQVESILDAAHALAIQCRRNLAIRKLSPNEARQRLIDAAQPAVDPSGGSTKLILVMSGSAAIHPFMEIPLPLIYLLPRRGSARLRPG
jgi:stage V sporulation protein R